MVDLRYDPDKRSTVDAWIETEEVYCTVLYYTVLGVGGSEISGSGPFPGNKWESGINIFNRVVGIALLQTMGTQGISILPGAFYRESRIGHPLSALSLLSVGKKRIRRSPRFLPTLHIRTLNPYVCVEKK